MSGSMALAVYVSAHHGNFNYHCPLWYYDLSGLVTGISAAQPGVPWGSPYLERRYFLCKEVGGTRFRKVINWYTPGTIWETGGTATVSLPNIDGTHSNYKIVSLHGEKWRGKLGSLL